MYGIRVRYNYYPRTFNVPKDGWLDVEGELGKWTTRKEAQAFIDIEDSTAYYLNHGEHSRRLLTVRKFRGKNGKI